MNYNIKYSYHLWKFSFRRDSLSLNSITSRFIAFESLTSKPNDLYHHKNLWKKNNMVYNYQHYHMYVTTRYSLDIQSEKAMETKSNFDNLNETLIITKSCAQRIKQQKVSEKNDNLGLRISVEGGGCSGFKYVFQMEDMKSINIDEDKVFERDGSVVIIDNSSFELVKGATIDYVQEMIRSAFSVINNPQSESACGCGSSFAVKNFASNPAID